MMMIMMIKRVPSILMNTQTLCDNTAHSYQTKRASWKTVSLRVRTCEFCVVGIRSASIATCYYIKVQPIICRYRHHSYSR